jgi:magnesium transporter
MIANQDKARPSQTIRETLDYITAHIASFDTITEIYVIDDAGKLEAVIPISDIFRHRPETSLGRIAKKPTPITVEPNIDQEIAAYLALEHNLRSVPVVDDEGKFLGALPSTTILSILHREAREDMLRMAGIHPAHAAHDDILRISLFEAFRHRFPWLFIGLLGGIVAARIIGAFEKTLESNLVLAGFIPLIVYMADAVGTQIETFTIRDFAVVSAMDYRRYFLKQFLVVLLISVVTALSLCVISLSLYREFYVSAVLGLSLFFAIMSSMFAGMGIPYLLNKAGFDPANASGPIATIIQDILSIVIYFAIAAWLLEI